MGAGVIVTEQESDSNVAPATRGGRRAGFALLFLIVAIGLAAVAFYYVGGMGYLNSLRGSLKTPASNAAAGVVASTTPTPDVVTDRLVLPPGVTEDLAKRMYVEQIQSQTNLRKMAEGQITTLTVTSVELHRDKVHEVIGAAVFVRAFFDDRTSAPGVIQLVVRKSKWYFMSFTGLRAPTILGSAETVQHGTVEMGEQENKAVIAASGVHVFDYAVINTFLQQQVENQTIVTAIVDGSVKKLDLGEPEDGAGTTSVPSTMTAGGVQKETGYALLIHKEVDFEDLTFLTTFKAN